MKEAKSNEQQKIIIGAFKADPTWPGYLKRSTLSWASADPL